MAARRRRVVWTGQARRMLDDAATFIAQDSRPAAERFLLRVLKAASSLGASAERGRVVPELDDPAVREIIVRRFRLLYQVAPDEIQILAFLHGARDLMRWRRG